MARSGSVDFSITGEQMIKDALRCIGVIASGENPTGQEITDGRRALNMMIKTWMGRENYLLHGLKVWQREHSAGIDPASAKNYYTIGASGCDLTLDAPPVHIIAMNYKFSTGEEVPLSRMTAEDYFRISNKAGSVGIPTRFYYERGYTNGTVYFDLTLSDDALDGTFPFLYLRELQDIDDVDDDLDFPVYWYEAIKYHLAIRLAPEYDKPVSPDLKELANLALEQAQMFEPMEASADYYFQPYKEDWHTEW